MPYRIFSAWRVLTHLVGFHRSRAPLFAASGKGEQIAQLILHAQQLATRARVVAFRGALREIEQQSAQPCRQRSAAAPEQPAQPLRMRFEEPVEDLVLERHDRLEAPRIALPAAASEKLSIDAPRIVALGGEHVQAAELRDAGPEPDVRAAAGHVRGRADAPGLPR